MKKLILTVVCLLCVGASVYYYLQKQPNLNSETEKMKWCYGVYHETKSPIEIKDHDIWLHFSKNYKDMEDSRSFKQGKFAAYKASIEQKTECYDRVYPMLAELQREKENLNNSVPYCFGYLEKAREGSYVPLFCKMACRRSLGTDCFSVCVDDYEKNLKAFPRKKGEIDAAKRVNPAQFVHCIEVLKGIM